MELYAIRHGQSETNVERRFCGWAQVSLTEKGMDQARQTREKLKDISFDRIISSDLLRAKQTTELVFPGCAYTEDARVREISVGEKLARRLRSDCLDEYGDLLKNSVSERDYSPFGGETDGDQYRRVAAFMDELGTFSDIERIAVVCHGGTIICMLDYVFHTQRGYRYAEVENASVTRFRRQDGVWKLIGWNEN